jgi:hypothetical protein
MDDLLTRLRRAGVEFRVRADGRLDFRGGTAADHATVRAHRDRLVEALRAEAVAAASPRDVALGLLARFDTLAPLELDRLVVLGLGYFDEADLARLNLALARRAGLDPGDVRETSRLFDRPPEGPVRL